MAAKRRLTGWLALMAAGRALAQLPFEVGNFEAEARRVRTVSRAVPRWDMSGGQVEPRWCLSDSSGNCQWGDYVASIVAASFPSIALFVCFTTLACCCCCNPHQLCFRWEPYSGLPCCPEDELAFRGYRRSQVNTARILLLLSFVLVTLFSVSGWIGQPLIDHGIKSLAKGMAAAGRKLEGDARALVDDIDDVMARQAKRSPVASTPRADPASWFDDARRLAVGLDRAHEIILFSNSVRAVLLPTALALPIVTTFCGLIASVLNLGPVVGAWGVATCMAMVLLWLILAMHSPLVPLFSDLCDHVDDVLRAERASSTDSFTGCTNGTTFARIDGALAGALQHTAHVTCAGLSVAMRSGELRGDAYDCTGYDELRANLTVVRCGDLSNVTLGACAEACDVHTLTSACSPTEPPDEPSMGTPSCTTECRAAVVHDAIRFHDAFDELRSEAMRPLRDCQFVVDTFEAVYGPMCVRLIVGLNSVTTAATTMGVSLIAPLLILTPLCKLFRKQNQHMYRRYGLHTASYIRARRTEAQADAAEHGRLGLGGALGRVPGRRGREGSDRARGASAA